MKKILILCFIAELITMAYSKLNCADILLTIHKEKNDNSAQNREFNEHRKMLEDAGQGGNILDYCDLFEEYLVRYKEVNKKFKNTLKKLQDGKSENNAKLIALLKKYKKKAIRDKEIFLEIMPLLEDIKETSEECETNFMDSVITFHQDLLDGKELSDNEKSDLERRIKQLDKKRNKKRQLEAPQLLEVLFDFLTKILKEKKLTDTLLENELMAFLGREIDQVRGFIENKNLTKLDQQILKKQILVTENAKHSGKVYDQFYAVRELSYSFQNVLINQLDGKCAEKSIVTSATDYNYYG